MGNELSMADYGDPVVIGNVPSTGATLDDRMDRLVIPLAFNGNVYCGKRPYTKPKGKYDVSPLSTPPIKFYPLSHPVLLRYLAETYASSCHKNYGAAMMPYLSDVVAYATQKAPMTVSNKFVSTTYGCAWVSIDAEGWLVVDPRGNGAPSMPRFLPVAINELSPLNCNRLPSLVDNHPLHIKASRPFASYRDYLVYLWLVGNCVVEPCRAPRILVLLGPGDTGKTQALESIAQWLGIDSATTLCRDSMLEKKPPGLDQDESMEFKACSHRYAYHGDVPISEENPPDFNLLKTITGDDSVSIHGVPTKPRCLLAFGSNGLDSYSPHTCENGTVQQHKRELNLLLNKPFDRSVDVAPVYGVGDCSKMLSAAVAVRLQWPSMPPLGVESLMLCLCKCQYKLALKVVRQKIGATPEECLRATYALAISLRMERRTLMQNVRAISPHHCGVCTNGHEYLADVEWTGRVL